MRLAFLILLLSTALGALYVAGSSEAPTYAPPVLEELPPPAPQVLVRDPVAGELVRVFDVDGMCCKTCTGKLYAELRGIEGVRAASVSFAQAEARVIVSEDLDPEPILAALNVSKYSARPRADASAVIAPR